MVLDEIIIWELIWEHFPGKSFAALLPTDDKDVSNILPIKTPRFS